jgi:N-acyl-L-homoserine lactone synthetase
MNTLENYAAKIYTGASIPSSILEQYGRKRYACFAKNDPNVALDHDREIELDQFDFMASTTFITVVKQHDDQIEPELVSAMRYRSTLDSYELEAPSYRYLTAATPLPKAANIIEGSRWVGVSSRSLAGKISTALMSMTLYSLAREYGFDEVIGTVSTKGQAWLDKRGASQQQASNYYLPPHDQLAILITRIALDDTFLQHALALLADVIKTKSMAEFAFATERAA